MVDLSREERRPRLRERYPLPIVHVMVLALATSLTNASAISPSLFGGMVATLPLATLTLMMASLEHVVRRWWMARGPLPGDPMEVRKVLRVHAWGCALAAIVSVTCAAWTLLALG